MTRMAATHLLILMIGIVLGVGAVAIANTDQPPAQAARASDGQIVQQLRKTNTTMRKMDRKLDILNRSTGGYGTFAGSPPLRALLEDIEQNTAAP